MEIANLRSKKTTPSVVNAIVNATGKVLTTVKMEMEYAKMSGRPVDMAFINPKNTVQIKGDAPAQGSGSKHKD